MTLLKILFVSISLIPAVGMERGEPSFFDEPWYSEPYMIDIGYRFSSRCVPGECEDPSTLTLVASVTNTVFEHSLSPAFPCCLQSRTGSVITPIFGHGTGSAHIIEVEMCPHLSGSGKEAQPIVSRNNDFEINLMVWPTIAAEEYQMEKYGYDTKDDIPASIQESVWMQFQALTPFDNPAFEWENSDGNGLMHTFSVIFSVYLDDLKNNRDSGIEVPESDECGQGIWSIQFSQIRNKQ